MRMLLVAVGLAWLTCCEGGGVGSVSGNVMQLVKRTSYPDGGAPVVSPFPSFGLQPDAKVQV